MQDTQKNNMLIKTILTVFLLFTFLAPISFSLKTYQAHALGPATTSDTPAVDADTDPVPPKNAIATRGDATQESENFVSRSASFVGGKIYDYTIGAAIAIIGNLILSLAAAFTWVGGKLLELTLAELVFGMGNQINSQALGTAIDSIWSLIRDICNLAFIFGFIYVGIYTIIDPEKADTKRFLSRIIIGALLINFSLFFTKIVIDFSNFSSVVIYTAMVESPETSTITGKIVSQLGLTTLYASPGAQILADIGSGKSIWFFIMGAIFLLVAAFVFFAASFLLVTRFVALVLIMVASPVLFAATVFPKTKSYADDIWKKLFSYAFFAPVYLLLTLITIKLMDALGVSSTQDKFVNALTDTSGTAFSVILNFVVIIFFLVSSLTIAKRMGIEGGEMAVSAGKAIRGKVQGAIGRNTVGRLGEKLAKNQDESRKSNSRFRQFYAASLRGTGIDAVAQSAKKAKFGSSQSRAEVVTENKEVAAARARNKTTSDISDAIAESATIDADPNASQSDKDTARVQMERAIANASTDQLLALLKKHESNTQEYATIVANMSESQVTSLTNAKQEDFDDGKKTKLRNQRRLIAEQRYSSAATRDALSRANADELASMSSEFLSREEHAMRLNSSQMDDLRKKLTKTEFENLSKSRERALERLAQGTIIDGKGSGHILNQKPGEIAKMPAKVLVSLADKLSVATLTKIVADGTLSKTDEGNIRTEITNAINTIPANATPQQNAQLAVLLDFMTNTDVGKRFGN